eukprot:CAMPEP_0179463328 /NCGR_PEP_ID=MMETSP0799-20121207/45425_1 /TAXON_ID=46947 /ORGANISM="Geminigera cryophila, Strain CCMP2564" /LENGTH=380 /DNA_ID=CAMNT_0021266563 /DNA_START=21 /DNA_END=1160 /DNA_ORIENTATION=+
MTPSQRSNLSVLVFAVGLFLGKFFELKRQSQFVFDISEPDIRLTMSRTTMLHIGGQHRGGTTLTWDGLQQHPDISSFGTVNREEDYDEDEGTGMDQVEKDLINRRLELHPHISQFRSEGVFLQDVLPKFSLHHPPWPYYWKKLLYLLLKTFAPALEQSLSLRQHLGGLAEYAFMKSSHLTETHALASTETAANLFRQWATIWDLRKKVLVEKSPSNVRISRLLNTLWTRLDGTARFVFVSRHPIMQAMALQEGGFATESMYDLIEHWLAIEESLAADLPFLPENSFRILQLDDVAKNPLLVMQDLFSWLEITPLQELKRSGRGAAVYTWATSVSSAPDDKYKVLYKQKLEDPTFAKQHARILLDFSARVRAVSTYELASW